MGDTQGWVAPSEPQKQTSGERKKRGRRGKLRRLEEDEATNSSVRTRDRRHIDSHSLTHTLTRSLAHLPAHSFSLTHSCTGSCTDSLTHSFTHLPPLPLPLVLLQLSKPLCLLLLLPASTEHRTLQGIAGHCRALQGTACVMNRRRNTCSGNCKRLDHFAIPPSACPSSCHHRCCIPSNPCPPPSHDGSPIHPQHHVASTH